MADGTVLVRRRALGDVVLLGAITASGLLEPPVTVVTDPRFVPLAARLRGVDRAVAFGTPVSGRVVDLQRDLHTLRAFPGAQRVRKHSVARWLRRRGWGEGRPSVPILYGRAAGVAPVEPPWIDVDEVPRAGLALLPGASCAPKRWAPDRLAAVGRAWPGPVWVVGGPGEEALVAEVAARVPRSVAVCGEAFPIDVLAACAVAVGGDTGLLHLAAAVGARPVAVFGPTHPDDGFFPYPTGRVVQRDLACRPCARHRLERCPLGHHRCMDIDASSVIAAVAR